MELEGYFESTEQKEEFLSAVTPAELGFVFEAMSAAVADIGNKLRATAAEQHREVTEHFASQGVESAIRQAIQKVIDAR